MFTLTQLTCFVAVAKHLNYHRAALELCITVTAVSKQIKNLEEQCEDKLFIRDTRNVSLTAFGALMLEKCQSLLEQSHDIEQFVESKQSTPQGTLTILVSNILARKLILEKLYAFTNHYPKIKCEFIFSEEDSALSRKDIDIMVGFPEIPPFTDRLKYRRMKPIRNILCGAPSLIEQYGIPRKASDLMSFPFISHSLRKPALELPLYNGNALPSPEPILYMNDFDALNQACKQGVGLFLTGDTLVENELKNKTLIQVLKKLKFKEYEIFTFYQSYGYEIPKIKAFLDFCFPQQ